ncbi:MAG: OmpA family protein [Bryobacteraceae bacterium]|nr:OmpA family protein [Bryobacteraceae bacterium]MDW8379682.1 flagellar motor protein MotB [Bryobacterales bacterium]
MAGQDDQIIIIKKKKGGHGGHHGGAWKVAYADFVTAMMALFIVLWLLSSSEEVQKAVGGYFQDPTGSGKLMGSTMSGSGEGLPIKETDMDQLKEKIEKALQEKPEFQALRKNVQIFVTGEGLRIELLENDKGMFFQSGSALPTEAGANLVAMLAQELGKLPNNVFLEGHTDAKPFSSENGYSNWELSADRANAARRIMMDNGLRRDQVTQVRGFADQRLRDPKDPYSPLNRRISLIVAYLQPSPRSTDSQTKTNHVSSAGDKDHGSHSTPQNTTQNAAPNNQNSPQPPPHNPQNSH